MFARVLTVLCCLAACALVQAAGEEEPLRGLQGVLGLSVPAKVIPSAPEETLLPSLAPGESEASEKKTEPPFLVADEPPKTIIPAMEKSADASLQQSIIPPISILENAAATAGTVPPFAPKPAVIPVLAGDQVKNIAAIADNLSGVMGNNIPGLPGGRTNPMDLLRIMETMQKAMDNFAGGDGECASVFVVMNHTLYTAKELIMAMNAMNKLGDLWGSINISTIGKCFVVPYMMPNMLQIFPNQA